jgi:hypothetical protein
VIVKCVALLNPPTGAMMGEVPVLIEGARSRYVRLLPALPPVDRSCHAVSPPTCVTRLYNHLKGLFMHRMLLALCLTAVVVSAVLVGQADAQDPIMCRGQVATQFGTSGDDTIIGTPGVDIITGLGGDDVIIGQAGEDLICGGDGADFLTGCEDNDELWGENGNDAMFGGSGNDRFFGNYGNDRQWGQDGDDNHNCGTDIGGGDADWADGGPGHDGDCTARPV